VQRNFQGKVAFTEEQEHRNETCPVQRMHQRSPYAAETLCESQGFGLRLIDPIDHYTLSDRATKYAMLFVVLTFAFVLLFEVMKSLRVHPIQYGLVGAALVMFFLLLVSLSEHISFANAYLVAAAACTLLLGVYAQAVLGGWARAASFTGLVAGLYGALYALLQLESLALLLGSGLLFATLAAIMIATRRVDWHAFGRRPKPAVAATPAVGIPVGTQE
jgi:inner membrane protein